MTVLPSSTVAPRIELGEWANDVVNWMTDHWDGFFTAIGNFLNGGVSHLGDFLKGLPIILLIIVAALIALLTRGIIAAVVSFVGFLVIDALDAFPDMLDTLSQILLASIIAILISVPVGILAARSKTVSTVVRPILDLMQTLPAYVYLIPFLFLFGIGATPGILATIIFALPPGVRLTELGIRQVDSEMVEAGEAFGATPREVLGGIQLPLALPTIMAGINQVIMLALSMTVIAGLVGAPGLGQNITGALSQLQVGIGVESGLAVVILAIYLDRVTDGLSKPEKGVAKDIARLRALNRGRAQYAGTAGGSGGGN